MQPVRGSGEETPFQEWYFEGHDILQTCPLSIFMNDGCLQLQAILILDSRHQPGLGQDRPCSMPAESVPEMPNSWRRLFDPPICASQHECCFSLLAPGIQQLVKPLLHIERIPVAGIVLGRLHKRYHSACEPPPGSNVQRPVPTPVAQRLGR